MTIKDKIQEIQEKFTGKYIDQFRKKNIPQKYNQIELMEELENEEIDHYISISNRTDGKSFNYIHYLVDYSIRTGVGFTLLARKYSVRFSYQKLLQEIIDSQDKYARERFHFIRNDFYVLVGYEDKEIGIITDLDHATDLKYLSNYIRHFPIMIYDEFLALEDDYLPDEWERLKTVYASIDRKEEIPFIKTPKILYLGNAVNFASPVLSNLKLFNRLETQSINTMEQYGNILLEIRRNDNRNNARNLRAFAEEEDSMTKGQFEVNTHNIATYEDIQKVNKNRMKIIIKFRNEFMVIEYNRKTFDIILSVTAYEEEYHFNVELKDNSETSIFLNNKYYDERHYLKYDKNLFNFNNQYSKDMILDKLYNASLLKIYKIIGVYEDTLIEKKEDISEIQYKDNYKEDTKKYLINKFFQ